MNQPRETIAAAFTALFDGLKGAPFATVSRVFQVPSEILPELTPALYIVEGDENVDEQAAYGLERYRFPFLLAIVALMPDQQGGTAPGTVLNPLLDAVDAAINPYPGTPNTLGGLVTNCYIDGRITKADKFQGPHVAASVPVTIMTGA
jgi:hypothetical protein